MDFLEGSEDIAQIYELHWPRRGRVHRRQCQVLRLDYPGRLARVFAAGRRMTAMVEGDSACTVALWRIIGYTYEGRRVYIDDLVTDAPYRAPGVAPALLGEREAKAAFFGCDAVALDSGAQPSRAHVFCFGAGSSSPAFRVRKAMR